MTDKELRQRFYEEVGRIASAAASIEKTMCDIAVALIDPRNLDIGEALVAGETFENLKKIIGRLLPIRFSDHPHWSEFDDGWKKVRDKASSAFGRRNEVLHSGWRQGLEFKDENGKLTLNRTKQFTATQHKRGEKFRLTTMEVEHLIPIREALDVAQKEMFGLHMGIAFESEYLMADPPDEEGLEGDALERGEISDFFTQD